MVAMDRSQAKPAASGPWDLLDCNTARRARQRRRRAGTARVLRLNLELNSVC